MKYPKNSFEARIDSLLPQGKSYNLIFFQLIREGGGGWSVNDSWRHASGVDREEAISRLRFRWEVFKANYGTKHRVSNITDIGDTEELSMLEVDCTAFANVEIQQ